MTSVVILNYNTAQLTLDCIDSIQKYVPHTTAIEIIVVDNCSREDDYLFLKSQLDQSILLLKTPYNGGFSYGNMFAMPYVRGEFLLFLNSDTYFIEDAISPLVEYMKSNKEVGVCNCLQLSPEGEAKISFDHFQGIRKRVLGKWFLESFPPKKPSRKKRYTEAVVVDFIQGSFMFFRKSAFIEVGGFDTNLFLYFEEMDICKRLKNKGYLSVFLPHPAFVHIHGASTHSSIEIKKIYFTSYFYVLKKSFGWGRYAFIKSWLIMKFGLNGIFNRKKRELFFYFLNH